MKTASDNIRRVEHTLPPWFDSNARALILGTMPSPKSRESGCYYGHPQNRFWSVMSAVFRENIPHDTLARKMFVTDHFLALWDVLASCDISGASDASIQHPVVNDLSPIFRSASIRTVFTTGKKAFSLYNRMLYPVTGKKAVCLPSPSSANAGVNLAELCQAYAEIRQAIE